MFEVEYLGTNFIFLIRGLCQLQPLNQLFNIKSATLFPSYEILSSLLNALSLHLYISKME